MVGAGWTADLMNPIQIRPLFLKSLFFINLGHINDLNLTKIPRILRITRILRMKLLQNLLQKFLRFRILNIRTSLDVGSLSFLRWPFCNRWQDLFHLPNNFIHFFLVTSKSSAAIATTNKNTTKMRTNQPARKVGGEAVVS